MDKKHKNKNNKKNKPPRIYNTETYPQNKRFCILIDRRERKRHEKDIQNKNNKKKKDDLIFFEVLMY